MKKWGCDEILFLADSTMMFDFDGNLIINMDDFGGYDGGMLEMLGD